MKYTQITYLPEVTVGSSPNITEDYCGYNPSTYKFEALLKGIYRDIALGAITSAKKRLTPGVAFYVDEFDPEAILGDAFRHIEFGRVFIKDYEEVKRPGEPLGPVSAYPVNIIAETDKSIEAWECSCSHNLHDFPQYFYDYSGFLNFYKFLKGSLEEAIDDAITVIVKSIILSNPTKTIIDSDAFARIFGKTRLNHLASSSPQNEAAREYNNLMQQKIKKYYGKASELWKNVQFYNPYWFSPNPENFEESRKDFFWEGAKPNQDKARKVAQELYTDAHSEELGHEHSNTEKIRNLTRNDSLIALYDFVSTAVHIMTTQKSSEFWLGNDTSFSIYEAEEAKKRALANQQHHIEGQPVGEGQNPVIVDTKTTSTADDGFEVIAKRENLGIHLNPYDYIDLKNGISRMGPNDSRSVKLSMMGEDLNIFGDIELAPGFVRIVDKQAVVVKPYYDRIDVAQPAEKNHVRYKAFKNLANAIFKNFAGCLGMPTPHFIAHPRLYNKHTWIGQAIEKKK